MKQIKIQNRYVGIGFPCLVMVDAGVNHNNDPKQAIEIVKRAADAGADVVKFQTYKADAITTKKALRYWDPKLDTDGGATQHSIFSCVDKLPLESYHDIKKACDEAGIIFCSTPFNLADVDVLEDVGIQVYKISSSDLTYQQLIVKVAQKGKPVVLSCGASSLKEINEAITLIKNQGNNNIILQHCVLSYPCKDKDANLAKMIKIQQSFSDIPVGYSDHTLGITIPTAAVAMGAKTIEKHFTIDKKLSGSLDHPISLNPKELKEMVSAMRSIEKSRGVFVDGYYESEKQAYLLARKSIVSQVDIPCGAKITKEMLTCKRPGTGIYPKHMNEVIGAIASVDIPRDTTVTNDMVKRSEQ